MSKEYELLKNELELAQEDIECVELFLDSKGIPRYAVDNQSEYSLVGRIKLYKDFEWLEKQMNNFLLNTLEDKT
tara:strand:+ start:481 stop:702 length:222 start_codon:yes stop_codon:yes gene_type:complete